MRLVLLLICVLVIPAQEARSQLPRRDTGALLFGSLLNDEDLQKELKMTDAQVKRMQEVYLQSQPPARIIFTSWGIKELGVSAGQMKQIGAMNREHLNALKKLRKESSEALGGDDFRLRFEKQQRMETALDERKLKVLTRTQWERFEKLRGKPYEAFGKPQDKPQLKPDV